MTGGPPRTPWEPSPTIEGTLERLRILTEPMPRCLGPVVFAPAPPDFLPRLGFDNEPLPTRRTLTIRDLVRKTPHPSWAPRVRDI